MLNPEGSRLFPQFFIFPRRAGKPDLRWREFDWKYKDVLADGARFRLYYYQEEEHTADHLLPVVSEQITYLNKAIGFTPEARFSYMLFSSHREFQQANLFQISEGVQGVTSTTETTMAIPYWGDRAQFYHISLHELVHQYQIQFLTDSGSHPIPVAQIIPLWFIEGMAEHISLSGVDPEAKVFLRDVVMPREKLPDYEPPKFFEEGKMNFISVYKLGQAKIDFLENKFGKGTSRQLLSALAKLRYGNLPTSFAEFLENELHIDRKAMEKDWHAYLKETYGNEIAKHKEGLTDYQEIKAAGENLDYFDVAPAAPLILTREMDQLTGVTSLILLDEEDKKCRIPVVRDFTSRTTRLYFMQSPTFTLSDNTLAFVAGTTSGPELEVKSFKRTGVCDITWQESRRFPLHKHGILQVQAVTFSPDQKTLLYAGVQGDGRQNLYTLPLVENESGASHPVLKLTKRAAFRGLSWGEKGIVASADVAETSRFDLFRVDLKTGSLDLVFKGSANSFSPDVVSDSSVFQYWEDGTPQAYQLDSNKKAEKRLTDIKTGFYYPKQRKNRLYALIFSNEHYRLCSRELERTTIAKERNYPAIRPPLPSSAFPEVYKAEPERNYKPFQSSGPRVENLAGFLSTGGFGGLTGTLSDLMRDYAVSGLVSFSGSWEQSNAYLFLSNQRKRATWTAGVYQLTQTQLFPDVESESGWSPYYYKETGGIAAFQYPLGAFSYFDAGMRVGGIRRRAAETTASRAAEYEVGSQSTELLLAPFVRYGFDQVLYELFSGPLQGFSFLAEAELDSLPEVGGYGRRFRFDVARYWQLHGRTVLALEGVAGAALDGALRIPFYVSSDDILRAYMMGDPRLLGNYLVAGKVELRVPVGSLVNFPPLRALVAYDYGSVANDLDSITDRWASSYTWGLTLNVPPISLNFLFSYPNEVAPGPKSAQVMHFLLRYLYL